MSFVHLLATKCSPCLLMPNMHGQVSLGGGTPIRTGLRDVKPERAAYGSTKGNCSLEMYLQSFQCDTDIAGIRICWVRGSGT